MRPESSPLVLEDGVDFFEVDLTCIGFELTFDTAMFKMRASSTFDDIQSKGQALLLSYNGEICCNIGDVVVWEREDESWSLCLVTGSDELKLMLREIDPETLAATDFHLSKDPSEVDAVGLFNLPDSSAELYSDFIYECLDGETLMTRESLNKL